MEAKTMYFSRRARHDNTGESCILVADDLRAQEGVSRTFTRRSAVVANTTPLRVPSMMTCSTVALRMFELDGRLSTIVACSGADVWISSEIYQA
jgi:hypothetical protein